MNTELDPCEASGMAQVRWMNRVSHLLMLVLLVLWALGIARWLVHLPNWKLQNIEVKGDFKHVPVQSFHQEALADVQGNYLTVNLRQVKASFEELPWVQTARIDRKWPMQLEVHLTEHVPAAYWGGRDQNTMVNAQGQLFAAEGDDESLPVLIGQEEYVKTIWDAYRNLAPVYQKINLRLQSLELDSRGSWRSTFDNGGVIELGRGNPGALVDRSESLVTHIQSVLAKHGRAPRHLQFADLRYPQGFAIRLEGVTVSGQHAQAMDAMPAAATPTGKGQTRPMRNQNG